MQRGFLFLLVIASIVVSVQAGEVLLIPESTNDTVGMYDPFDGSYLGDLITGHPDFGTPLNAIQGPDGRIYVSDQVADAVLVFDTEGTFIETYADSTDGLNNIRGIDFYQGNLYVTSGDDFIAIFSAAHTREADFFSSGYDPFDIFLLDDGKALVADIMGTTDNVSLFNADGTVDHLIFSVNFPEQIQRLPGGNYICAGFSENMIITFDVSGSIAQVPYISPRGVLELGNGNWLVSGSDGIYEVDPITGNEVTTIRTGVSGRYIELVDLPGGEPTPTPSPVCINHGDTNLDGAHTAGDAQMTFQIALGSIMPTFEEACAADCNGDDAVTAGDAQQIFLVALGSESCTDPLPI